MRDEGKVGQAVPFFMVADMTRSLAFYVDGLGFARTNQWIVDGDIRWCWLELGGASLMLQQFAAGDRRFDGREGPLGRGVAICFMCADAIALYHAVIARRLSPKRPFVGNGLWVTSLSDPDGYRLDFESPTNVPEETEYQG
jgi:catechol 2,3-dioxygenase-like lactoylglutathione lyase family enzyme